MDTALENVQRNSGTSRVPVIVFIPGDSFSSLNSGSAYDGSVLASYGNIVVVTINYRLGVLGEDLSFSLFFASGSFSPSYFSV